MTSRDRVEQRIAGQLAGLERRRRRNVRLLLVCAGAAAVAVAIIAAAVFGGAPAPARAEAGLPPIVGVVKDEAVAATAAPETDASAASESSTDLPEVEAPKPAAPAKPQTAATQRLSVRIGTTGYEPSALTASSDRPIVLTVGKGEGCAAGFLMDSLGIAEDNSSGPVTIELGTLEPGTYRFTCGMGMVEGRLVVR